MMVPTSTVNIAGRRHATYLMLGLEADPQRRRAATGVEDEPEAEQGERDDCAGRQDRLEQPVSWVILTSSNTTPPVLLAKPTEQRRKCPHHHERTDRHYTQCRRQRLPRSFQMRADP